jgi:hypothetical protein
MRPLFHVANPILQVALLMRIAIGGKRPGSTIGSDTTAKALYERGLKILDDIQGFDEFRVKAMIKLHYARALRNDNKYSMALTVLDEAISILGQLPESTVNQPWEDISLFALRALRLETASRIDRLDPALHNKELPALLRMCADLSPAEAALEVNQLGMAALVETLERYNLKSISVQLLAYKSAVHKRDVRFDASQLSDPLIPTKPEWKYRTNLLTQRIEEFYRRAYQAQRKPDENLIDDLMSYLEELGISLNKPYWSLKKHDITSLLTNQTDIEINTARREALALMGILIRSINPEVARQFLLLAWDGPEIAGLAEQGFEWAQHRSDIVGKDTPYRHYRHEEIAGLPITSKAIFLEQTQRAITDENYGEALKGLQAAGKINEFAHIPHRPWELLYPDIQLAVDELICWHTLSQVESLLDMEPPLTDQRCSGNCPTCSNC